MTSRSPLEPSALLGLPSSLRIISLNCWGLKFISKHRNERLVEIGRQLASASPPPSIVGLQECWTQQDYLAIRDLTKDILPHGKFYYSGIFGGGLAILSKWPIEESTMFRYPLNGRPAAFYRGDWYVGKGVACARIRIGPAPKDVVEVFCTHLHAPYEPEPRDSYLCHRTAQAWEIAKLMRHAAERGHMVLALGDFNMVPLSLAHRLIESHSPCRDVWRVLKPNSALGAADHPAERARRNDCQRDRRRSRIFPSAAMCLAEHGATCDSKFNTWRWSKPAQKALARGVDPPVDPDQDDRRAKRLDYIFFADNANAATQWRVTDVNVGMTMRHPTLRCSLSDHFSVEATLERSDLTSSTKDQPLYTAPPAPLISYSPPETYIHILDMIDAYDLRERRQRRQRLAHFGLQICIAIACFVAVWWAPYNFVAFILMLVSTLGFAAGVLDGLMGGLFVGSEIRALKEFRFEIESARARANVERGNNEVEKDDYEAVRGGEAGEKGLRD